MREAPHPHHPVQAQWRAGNRGTTPRSASRRGAARTGRGAARRAMLRARCGAPPSFRPGSLLPGPGRRTSRPAGGRGDPPPEPAKDRIQKWSKTGPATGPLSDPESSPKTERLWDPPLFGPETGPKRDPILTPFWAVGPSKTQVSRISAPPFGLKNHPETCPFCSLLRTRNGSDFHHFRCFSTPNGPLFRPVENRSQNQENRSQDHVTSPSTPCLEL